MDMEKIIHKIINLEQGVQEIKENMVDKNMFLDGQDKIMVILKRLDQERVFDGELIKRLETDVGLIKTHMRIA